MTWLTNLTVNVSENFTSMESMADNSENYKQLYQRAQFATGLICIPILCVIGLTGNMLSIIVLGQKKMQTSTNTYLISMAFSDSIRLLNDVFYFVVILLLHVQPEVGNRAYAYLYPYAHYFFNMSVCITAWLTVVVAAERYLLVCHPTTSRGVCNVYRARIISCSVFVSMSLLTVPLGLRYRTIEVYSNKSSEYVMEVQVTELWQNETFVLCYTWVQNLLRTIIPLVILCTLNCFIVLALRKTRSTKKKMSARHRITLMLISVIFVFVVCCTPDAIMSAVFGFGYTDANYLVRAIREITDMLLTVNSAVNFILYCIFNKVFRQNFVTLMSSRKNGSHMIAEETAIRKASLVTVRPADKNGIPLHEICEEKEIPTML